MNGPTQGDTLYAWQEQTLDGKWGLIHAFIPLVGIQGVLMHRDEQIVRELMGPIAEGHVSTTGNPLRLARFDLGAVLDR